jgi:hypothetical protein
MAMFQFYTLKFVFLMLFFLPISGPLVMAIQYSKEHWHLGPLEFALGAATLLWLLISRWLAHEVAYNYAFENHTLLNAIRFAYYEARLRLAFLPIVGHWLAPARDREEGEDADEPKQ